MKKQKWIYLQSKMPILGIFDQKRFIWLFLGRIFRKIIAIFEIGTLKIVYLQNFTKKNAYIWDQNYIFWLEFENNIFIFEISTLEFVLLQNFAKKRKCLNLGAKIFH